MTLKVCLLGLMVLACIISSVSAVAVMSVDLGTEWMKVAVVSVSKHMYLIPLRNGRDREQKYPLLSGLINIFPHLIIKFAAWCANGNRIEQRIEKKISSSYCFSRRRKNIWF